MGYSYFLEKWGAKELLRVSQPSNSMGGPSLFHPILRVATVRFSSVSSNLTGVTLGSVTVRFGSNWYG